MTRQKKDYPVWVCRKCGLKHGRREPGVHTMHKGKCGVCGDDAVVTEPRDYGHLSPGWENEKYNVK